MQNNSLDNVLRLAEKHFQEKDYQACEKALNTILLTAPDHAGANELLA